MPKSAVRSWAAARMSRRILSRPVTISSRPPAASSRPPEASGYDSSAAASRFELRITSIKSWFAIALRVSPSRMSSSRDCAPRSSFSRWKNSNGSEIRQRA